MKIEMKADTSIGAPLDRHMSLFFLFIVLLSIRALVEGLAKFLFGSVIKLWSSPHT